MTWERADPGPPNPLAWSVPLVPILGIRFRIHFSFLLFAALVFLRATVGPPESAWLHGAKAASLQLGALLAVVLWRELVRAFVVRAAGGTADEVMLWPLGSLQGIDPAVHAKDRMDVLCGRSIVPHGAHAFGKTGVIERDRSGVTERAKALGGIEAPRADAR